MKQRIPQTYRDVVHNSDPLFAKLLNEAVVNALNSIGDEKEYIRAVKNVRMAAIAYAVTTNKDNQGEFSHFLDSEPTDGKSAMLLFEKLMRALHRAGFIQ